ncbi:DUF3443 domain-containing protein [Paraburkholderia caffeinilytica]|uniref:DUF3443 domain-containing protein n=1 Tax=Paraburkholderia caffeinilytica TaxID=1761016 RepID=UPI0038B914E3
MKTFKKRLWAIVAGMSVALAACGGGGSGDGSNQGSALGWNATPDWINTPGGSGNSGNAGDAGNTSNIKTDKNNTVPIRVDNSMGGVNMLSTSIKVCVPGTQPGASQCVTVDRMLVDTGSTGVRITASAIQALNAQLLTQVGAVDDKPNGNYIGGAYPIAECMPFASGFTFGSIKRADITIGSRTASNIPIQVIGDGAFSTPADCIAHGGTDLSTAQSLGANGILGISNFTSDSKDALDNAMPGLYYYCPSQNSCISTRMTAAKEVMNPVAAFDADYNGTVIRLPAVPASGQAGVAGQLIFGVGTQANNALPTNANYFAVDQYGGITTQYQGTAFNMSAIDSGTNGYAFPDSSIPTTSGWYTPTSTLSLDATMEATNGSGTPYKLTFPLDNAVNLMASGNAAYNNVGWNFSYNRTFLWGLPFFYGRSVYTVIGNNKVGTHTGPFVAF